jgi:hypothetical protein
MQLLFFVVPPSKIAAMGGSDVHNYLQLYSENRNGRWMWQQSWNPAVHNWRGLTITKLTQSTDTISRLKNLPKQKLQLAVAAADLQIKLFFNCRPH